MDFEKYTERARGFIQSAQGLALRSNHQKLTAEHLLKVIIDDEQGLAGNLIKKAGGDPVQARTRVETELGKLPKVEGSGAGQLHLTPELARIEVPALCLCGDGDASTPPELMRELAGLLGSARYQEIAGTKHLPCIERPDAVARHVITLVEESGRG
mgnify:CR=1 FL=1